MKLLSFLSLTTLVAGAAFVLGLAFDAQALPLFGILTSTAMLLVVSQDYLPAVGSATRSRKVRTRRAKYTLPYAA